MGGRGQGRHSCGADNGRAREGGAMIPIVELYFPRSGDDLAKDLEQGLPAPLPLTEVEIAALALPAPADQPALPLGVGDAPGALPVWPGAGGPGAAPFTMGPPP